VRAAALIAASLATLVVGLARSDAMQSLFAHGDDTLLRYAQVPSVWMMLGLAIIWLGFAGTVLAENAAWPRVILVLGLLQWALAGPSIAIYGDGHVHAGWYFIPTVEWDPPGGDPELGIPATTVRSRGWKVRFSHKLDQQEFFAGPWLAEPALELAREQHFDVPVEDYEVERD
jgi:hypothetical protein